MPPPQVSSIANLTNAGEGYRPLAQGSVPYRRFATEGIPFPEGPTGMILAMLAAQPLQRFMGEAGMTPMGLGHDQNVYDRLQAQRYTHMQMQAMQTAAASDRDTLTNVFRGIASVTGTPYGAEQRRAAQALAGTATTMAPMLADIAPDLLDQFGGRRGSATVMAKRIIDSGRYRIDPVTGQLGMSGETAGRVANQIHSDLFSDENIANMRGVTAGQVGGMIQELQMRGMLGTAATGTGGRFRGDDPRASALAALSEIKRTRPEDALQITKSTGVDAGKPGGITAEDLDKLVLDPQIADKMRSFDAGRVTRAVKGYVNVVSAMKDIFGDMGRPNAPMSELIAGIEALTMGGLSQIDPGRMSSMVRQTYNLAKQTGVSVDNVLMMQNHAAQRAAQMGIEPAFAIQATQGALAFGGAYRAQGQASVPAWGAMTADQVQQLDANLRIQAASSNTANRMAVATRLADTLGGFDPNSDAGRYVSAIRSGMTAFETTDGKLKSVMLSDRELTNLFTGAKTADGRMANISEDAIQSMLGQRDTNREYVEKYNITNAVRRIQGTDELHPFVGNRLQETLTAQFRDKLVRQGVATETAEKQAKDASQAISQRVASRIFDMAHEDFRDTTKRNQGIAALIEEELATTGQGDVLAGLDEKQRAAFLTMSADRFIGATNRAIKGSMYSAFGNIINVHSLTNNKTLDEADNQQMKARFTAEMQEALAPLGTASLLSRASDALQAARPDDPRGAAGVIAETLGGVSIEDINKALLPKIQELNAKKKSVEELQSIVIKADTPGERAAAIARLENERRQLAVQANALAKTGEQFGLFTVDTVTKDDIARATNSKQAVTDLQRDIVGIRGNFGYEVSPQQLADFKATNPGMTDEAATAAIRERRRMLAYRADDEAIADVKKEHPELSNEEAKALANARLHSERLGVGEKEVAAYRERADNKSRLAGPRGELSAINELFAARTAKQFEVSDADIEAATKLPNYKAPTAADIQRYRSNTGFTGSDAQAEKEVQKARILNTRRDSAKRLFTDFWFSQEGALTADTVKTANEDVETVASKLIASPQTVQKLGTRAIEMSESLKSDQQRLRDLASMHTGSSVSKLLAGDFTSMDWSKPGIKAKIDAITAEVQAIQKRQQATLDELSSHAGVPGRNFQLGDEASARKQIIDAEVQAGRMSSDAASIALSGGALSPELNKAVTAIREQTGNEAEALRLMGKKPGDVLTDGEKIRFAELTKSVGITRKLNPADESTLTAYGKATDRMRNLISERGLSVSDVESKDAALTLTDPQAERMSKARRDFTTADININNLTLRLARQQSILSKFGDKLTPKDEAQKATVIKGIRDTQTELNDNVARRNRAEAIVVDDAKAFGQTPTDYLRGKGWLDKDKLTEFKDIAVERAADKAKIEELAKSLGLKPEELSGVADVSKLLNDAQSRAFKKDAASTTDIARDIMRAYGFAVGDSPDAFQKSFGQLMESTAGRGTANRILETQKKLVDVASKKAGSPGGLTGVDALAADYFKAIKSGRSEDVTSFRKAYGMFDIDSHGQLTGESDKAFSEFEKAIEFQQQTGLLSLGGTKSHYRNKNDPTDLARIYTQAMTGGELRSSAAGAGSSIPGRIEMSGSVTIKGDQMDFAGAVGGGRAYATGVT